MVRNGHVHESTDIPELPYAPPPGAPSAGVEVMTLTDLRVRAEALGQDLADPQRPDFHQLFAVESGTLRQAVDFTEHATPAGGWLWVRPGQVQQYGDLTRAEGALVLFQPTFPDPATASAVGLDEASGAVARHPVGERGRAARLALDHLRFEFAAAHAPAAGPPALAHTEVLRHLLAALLLRVTRLDGHSGDEAGPEERGRAAPDTFRRFRAAVERDFALTRRVADYAHALGYSPRTLSRATRAAAGLGAKEFVDRRVVLEARRLLAHTDNSASHIATHLGFADATNFSKFFHQRTGTTPGAFRASVRG
ncbi:helix-turn-helix transcriptional regulator [Streptomyces iconiensis]|uniref:AraC family transcriptional regulator n=1 Tax=Streptomyces iconiensis TaxID=1384038 RepID=A0ABT7ABS6_9ACTN|nr:AraC family transcriptional regulator [Streptomyces iconiensis]MDJ1138522.1 AraC family transcriptional regulator [Streptomyces iconiensis]